MIELEPITLKQYVELEDKSEYDFAMKYSFKFIDRIDEYGVGEIQELSFGFIKDLQYEFEQGIKFDKLISFIFSLEKLKKLNPANEPLDKFSRFVSYIVGGIKDIIEVENQTLAPSLDADEEKADLDRFNGLGVYLQIRSLTGGDVTKFDQVRALPYSLCFTEMYTAKQINDYERELIKIRTRKDG